MMEVAGHLRNITILEAIQCLKLHIERMETQNTDQITAMHKKKNFTTHNSIKHDNGYLKQYLSLWLHWYYIGYWLDLFHIVKDTLREFWLRKPPISSKIMRQLLTATMESMD